MGPSPGVAEPLLAFFSLFPILLLGLAVIGFAVADDPRAQVQWTRRLTEAVPGLGALVGGNVETLVASRAGVGIAGVLGLIWSAIGVAATTSAALRDLFRVEARHGMLVRKLKAAVGLAAIGALGLLSIVVAGAATAAAGGVWGPFGRAAGLTLAFALDVVVFATAYRVLTFGPGPGLRAVVSGATLAAAGWMALKTAGSWYAQRTVADAELVYGTFAATIGVLVILQIASRIFVYGAALGAVLDRGGIPMQKENGARAAHPSGQDGKRTVDLVRAIATDTGTLVRKEVELARAEILESVMARVRAAAGMIVLGLMGFMALLFLALGASDALATRMPEWAARLVVGGCALVLGIAGYAIAKPRSPMPSPTLEETRRTVKEDVEWAKRQLTR